MFNDELRATGNDRGKEADQGRNISLGVPHNGHQDRANKLLVVGGKGAGWVGLKQRREELENVGHEF